LKQHINLITDKCDEVCLTALHGIDIILL